MNVPLLNSEQLYQALRRIGRVETELVVYPDQWHGIETPSYRKDRWERYLAWYDRFLRPGAAPGDRKPEATSLLGQPLFAPEVPEETRKGLEETWRRPPPIREGAGQRRRGLSLGRRHAALGQYREAIDVYTRALAKHPDDARLYRHRGHRPITVRELDKAVADLTRAAALVEGRPDEPEPDSTPRARRRRRCSSRSSTTSAWRAT